MSEQAVQIVEQAPAPAQHGDGAVVLGMIDRLLARPDVPVEKLEQLFALHQKVNADAARRAYLAAFADLQAQLPAVERRGKGHNDKAYARFEDIIEKIRGPLSAHGFSLSFRIKHEGDKVRVIGVLGHRAGHEETTDLPLVADTSGSKNAVQSWGSSISYGKRYVTLTLLGIATENEDDDGKRAEPTGMVTPAQIEELTQLIKDAGADLGWICQHHCIEELADMTAKDFVKAKAGLIARKRQKAVKP